MRPIKWSSGNKAWALLLTMHKCFIPKSKNMHLSLALKIIRSAFVYSYDLNCRIWRIRVYTEHGSVTKVLVKKTRKIEYAHGVYTFIKYLQINSR